MVAAGFIDFKERSSAVTVKSFNTFENTLSWVTSLFWMNLVLGAAVMQGDLMAEAGGPLHQDPTIR